MASIYKDASIAASPEAVWDVVRDVGAVHTRFAPGFVIDVALEDGARMVTFGNGLVAREVFVTVDEANRRLVYSVRSERMDHHNASFQVFPDGSGSRLVWIADVLPEAAGATVDKMMQAGIEAAKACLDKLGVRAAVSIASRFPFPSPPEGEGERYRRPRPHGGPVALGSDPETS